GPVARHGLEGYSRQGRSFSGCGQGSRPPDVRREHADRQRGRGAFPDGRKRRGTVAGGSRSAHVQREAPSQSPAGHGAEDGLGSDDSVAPELCADHNTSANPRFKWRKNNPPKTNTVTENTVSTASSLNDGHSAESSRCR